MPKAILEFQLPEEDVEFRTAAGAQRLLCALSEVRNHLRQRRKYAELGEEALAEIEAVERLLAAEDIEDLFY